LLAGSDIVDRLRSPLVTRRRSAVAADAPKPAARRPSASAADPASRAADARTTSGEPAARRPSAPAAAADASAPPARRPSAAKIRLLEVADELFYAQGINTVGIDRIIAEAGVTKATFYKQYGSKDALILEYVTGRDRQIRGSLEDLASSSRDAATTLRSLVGAIIADTGRLDFRGCPFLNAAAEFADPAHPIRRAIIVHRDWFTSFLEKLLQELGHPAPGDAADELYLLRDGAMAGGYAGDPIAATSALTRAAERILSETKPR
jgi:AcrR family transcriptional regulator